MVISNIDIQGNKQAMEKQLLKFINTSILNEMVEISADDELLISGLVDSMNVMRLVSFVKSEFKLEIAPHEITIENFSSVKRLSIFLDTKINTA